LPTISEIGTHVLPVGWSWLLSGPVWFIGYDVIEVEATFKFLMDIVDMSMLKT